MRVLQLQQLSLEILQEMLIIQVIFFFKSVVVKNLESVVQDNLELLVQTMEHQVKYYQVVVQEVQQLGKQLI